MTPRTLGIGMLVKRTLAKKITKSYLELLFFERFGLYFAVFDK